ncbi:CDP-alcohol phosphatidyltransferase family protein [Roseomonas acroporae]|uniref:CDP-alcohol phosphatidyltransferase family protein n=1 Tax=Roseomonas acroporae TaxID=2937791 RepID=UPI0024A70CB4|nr:CDP-alcohol phosphatidyltransferase family protein [Roseomonas acroporae]
MPPDPAAPRPGGQGGAPAPPTGAAGTSRPPAPDAPPPAVVLTLPNVITLMRLCAVPATIWLILQGRLDAAFWLFVAAGVSDGLDGWLARVRNARSALGALLDPVADKALLVSVYVTLAAIGVLPDWLAILVVFRDLVIVGGVALLALLGPRPPIRPLPISKLNTLLQIALAGVALLLAGPGRALGGPLGWLQPALVWLVAASTLASGAAYVRAALRPGGGPPATGPARAPPASAQAGPADPTASAPPAAGGAPSTPPADRPAGGGAPHA